MHVSVYIRERECELVCEYVGRYECGCVRVSGCELNICLIRMFALLDEASLL